MANSPAPVQPVETPAQQVLDAFERAFIFSGTRAEFNRSSRLILPFVNQVPYEVKFCDCDCLDLEVWYVRDAERRIAYFYSLCHEHRLQPLGRAVKCQRQPRSERTERRRKSGYTTQRWYARRGV